jgi:hypothetical protein
MTVATVATLICAIHATPPTEWRVSDAPILSIGTAVGEPAYEFGHIGGVLHLGDGRIVVADGSSNELRFFGSDGRFRQAVGRSGEGPGEFKRLGRIWLLPGDTIVAYDNDNHRISLFSADGRFVRSGSVAGAVVGRFMSATDIFPDGSLLARSFLVPRHGTYDLTRRDSVSYYRVLLSGTVVTEFGTFPGTEEFVRAGEGGITVMPRMFGRQAEAVVAAGRLFVGTQDSYHIHSFHADGSSSRPIQQSAAPRPVRRADVTRMRTDWVAQAGSAGARRFRQDLVGAMPIPANMPAHGRLMSDTAGMLWVEDYRLPSESPAWWTVFDTAGRAVARVAVPVGLHVRQIGSDYVLGTTRTALGVELVRLHALDRR